MHIIYEVSFRMTSPPQAIEFVETNSLQVISLSFRMRKNCVLIPCESHYKCVHIFFNSFSYDGIHCRSILLKQSFSDSCYRQQCGNTGAHHRHPLQNDVTAERSGRHRFGVLCRLLLLTISFLATNKYCRLTPHR